MDSNQSISGLLCHDLPITFTGTGEVKGFNFTQVFANDKGYIYRVETGTSTHYEVFRRRTVPVCLDFDAKIFSETESKVTYPKANSFGDWAWTAYSVEDGVKKLL